jgi:uncharacterized membrane protein
MPFSRTQVGLLLALLLGNAIILYSNLEWVWLRFPAALALTFVLPGWAWLLALGWMQTDEAIERIVLVIGCSSVLSALVLLIALLLPGPFTETPNLVALNLATLTGLLYPSISRLIWRMANGEWRMANKSLISNLQSPISNLQSLISNLLLRRHICRRDPAIDGEGCAGGKG